ncbi:uncharacterized protein bcl2l12 isoform X2 [Mugil cephalus]|uniref:uncharacterized protein bcl2l12 isoform X2 n=1 Tax=Mugil cephalus TaxID=48193 RepID=UPI001FB5AB4F|nr:uncharacterized protein bcl2l12 isoform X2 [Mugil cephalus]
MYFYFNQRRDYNNIVSIRSLTKNIPAPPSCYRITQSTCAHELKEATEKPQRPEQIDKPHANEGMSLSAGRLDSTSSVSSISLVEIKTETRLVLQAFLHQTLSTPLTERPGRVGGGYKDSSKYSTKPQPKSKDGAAAQAKDDSSGDEKKTGFKSLIKKLPRRNTSHRHAKNSKGSLERNSKGKIVQYRSQTDDDITSSSSSDEDEDGGKKSSKKINRKKVVKKLSKFFKKKSSEKQKNGPSAQRPETLAWGDHNQQPDTNSPNNPPEFYTDVAEKLERIARRTSSVKKPKITVQPPTDDDTVVQQLVQLLSMEGDAINAKIQSDPALCANLNRLSYGSFAQILDFFGSSSQLSVTPPQPVPDSPTLQRMVVTMEVSRRIVTATGRMQGFAERYMENFYPYIKQQGGWEHMVDLEDSVEYD